MAIAGIVGFAFGMIIGMIFIEIMNEDNEKRGK